MNNKKSGLVFGLSMIALTTAAVTSLAPLSHADTTTEVLWAQANAGNQLVVIGEQKCPCVRWQVKAKAGELTYQNTDILISSEALLEFAQTNSIDFQKLESQSFSVGQAEIVAKAAHIGVGFDGVKYTTSNPEQGFKDTWRTGFYALVNIFQNELLRLDAHGGYDWDRFTNMLGTVGTRGLFKNDVTMHWESGPWKGKVDAYLGFETDNNFFNPNNMVGGADANIGVRVVAFSDFELRILADVNAGHDGFLERALGLKPNFVATSIMMSLDWDARDHGN